MNFYALYSRSSDSYNTPFLAHDDDEARRIIEKTVTLQSDMALIYSLDDLQIECVGIFESNSAFPVEAVAEITIVCEDLVNDLCYPPMIRAMINRLFVEKVDGNGK